MSLALAIACKDEAADLRELVESSRPFVDEVVVIADPDSTDDSVEVAHELADRVYELRFPGSFGELATLAIHLCAPHEWSLRLDCDERMGPEAFAALRAYTGWSGKDQAYALPRRRWADKGMTKLIEPGPDWQVRLIPVRPETRFVRRLHPDFRGLEVAEILEMGPPRTELWIEHFHDLKSPELLAARQALYIGLARREGISVEGGQPLDAVCACGHVRAQHWGAFEYAKPPFRCMYEHCHGCQGFKEAT